MTTLTQYANASVIAKDDLGKDPSSDWSLQTNHNMTVTGPSQLSTHNKVMDCLRFFYKNNQSDVMRCRIQKLHQSKQRKDGPDDVAPNKEVLYHW